MKKLALLFAVVFSFSLAWCDSGGGDEDGTKGKNGSQGAKDMCGGLCESGQYCFNGVCVNGCVNDEDCGPGRYCVEDDFFDQGHCADKEVKGCTKDEDCQGAQVCFQQVCVTPAQQPEGGCKWKSDMTDGCAENEVCVEPEEEGGKSECYAMPSCGQDFSCPTGMIGSVCNEDASGNKIVPTKGRICLVGVCKSNENCPGEWECVDPTHMGIGTCVPAAMMPGTCKTDADCKEGEKCEIIPGIGGQCVPGFGF